MATESRRTRLRFGVFEVDLAAGELRRQGLKVKLHDKAFQLLLALLDRPGELVTRQELQRHLWPADTFVDFDNNLNNAISRLREALGDAADNPRFIETVPRRGYRFIAPITQSSPDAGPLLASNVADVSAPATDTPARDAPPSTPADSATRRDGQLRVRRSAFRPRVVAAAVLAAAVLVTFALLGATPWWSGRPDAPATARVQSIAVLPFLNLSGDGDQEYLADGLTEALIMELSRLASLRVTSRTSAMHYKATGKQAPQIAKELSVDALVEGSIIREGDRVRVTVQLISAATDGHLWSNTFERELGSLLTLQREVATAIAGEIRLTLMPKTPREGPKPELSADLADLYLRGRHLLNRHTEPELQQALSIFEQIVERVPNYAPAHTAVAAAWEALASWSNFVKPNEGFPNVKLAAARALALDPSLAEAHARLAFATETFDFDLAAAEAGYQRAIELDPSSALAYQRYSNHLARTRRFEQALEMATRAQQLDPFELEVNVQYAVRLNDRGRREEAVRHMLHTIELDPTYYDSWVHLSYLYESLKRPHDQIAAAVKAVDLSNRAPHAVHTLARAYAGAGRTSEARKLVEELSRAVAGRNALEVARLYFVLQQPARGLFWLQQACVERSVGMGYFQLSHTSRMFDPVRSDPRFQQVLACVGVEATQ